MNKLIPITILLDREDLEIKYGLDESVEVKILVPFNDLDIEYSTDEDGTICYDDVSIKSLDYEVVEYDESMIDEILTEKAKDEQDDRGDYLYDIEKQAKLDARCL